MIEDLDQAASADRHEVDLCIVGSGPVGLAIALAFVGRQESVVVVETGGDAHEPATEALSAVEVAGHRRAHPNAVRRRIFGGTSSVWSGRCMPFSALDLQHRSWIPHSGWPLRSEDVDPWLAPAGQLLQAGPAVYDDRLWAHLGTRPPAQPWDPSRFVTQVFQPSVVRHERTRTIPAPHDPSSGGLAALNHSSAPGAEDIGENARERLRSSGNVTLLLHAHATEVCTDESGRRATGVQVRSLRGARARIRARRVVLACGGIDNARLLLLSRAPHHPAGLGNAHDQVGRYLMDHHYAPLGSIPGAMATALRRRMGWRWFRQGGQRHLYLTGASLSPQRQREEQLPRATLFLFEHPQRAAALSSAARIARTLRGRDAGIEPGDVNNVLGHPLELLRSAWEWRRHGLPVLLPVERIDVGCNVEQLPDADSRVTLGSTPDAFGQPIARVDWRLHDREFAGYRRTAALFAEECRRLGLPVATPSPWLRSGDADWKQPLHDMAHPMGSTRMSDNPRSGVVDRHGAVHGVDGLFVAGSSVFATGGTSNPTLMAVALALRLADRLRTRQAEASGPAAWIESAAEPRLRVGLVGGGDRVRNQYRPVLAALARRVDVVGIATRSEAGGRAAAEATGYRAWPSPAALVEGARPDVVIAVIPGGANVGVLHQLLGLGVPVLGETPVAWSLAAARGVVGHARGRGLPLGIAEQFPFLPAERLKRKLVELGVLGRLTAVVNDFATYDYHGIAQLRAWVGAEHPAIEVVARRHAFGRSGVPDGAEPATRELGWEETWLRAEIRFAGGCLGVHDYSPGFSVLPTRPAGSLRIHGQCGSVVDESLVMADRVTGAALTQAFRRRWTEGPAQRSLAGIEVAHPALGTIAWENPFAGAPLTDEQVAIAQHVAAFEGVVRHGAVPLYTGAEAALDMALLEAITESADRDGARLGLPRQPQLARVQRIFRALRRRAGLAA
jgi:choline dehydrogenase-like flavoprotein/predicted dehydrogenase